MHEALDPEFSILKQRLARRMRYEGTDEEGLQKMTLVDMTQVRLYASTAGVRCIIDMQSIDWMGVTSSYGLQSNDLNRTLWGV